MPYISGGVMMDDDDLFKLLALFIVVVFVTSVASYHFGAHDKKSYKEIIKHNCAEYDSKTKEFKWIVGSDE